MKPRTRILLISLLSAACLAVLTGTRTEAYDSEILSVRVTDSAIYPGTERTVQVYVPAAYDGTAPACLLVRMDGGAEITGPVLDSLIREGSIPVIIGIFVPAGRIYDPDGNVVRYNRSNEFDRMDGRMAAFLESEVLPKVEELQTSDGRQIRLSDRAADRMIMGGSSGMSCPSSKSSSLHSRASRTSWANSISSSAIHPSASMIPTIRLTIACFSIELNSMVFE